MASNERSTKPLFVINAGLFKTGTASMAKAYGILGLRAYHSLETIDIPEHWGLMEEAAEATWPNAPRARPRAPFTRADWDRVFGGYDAVTDVAAVFAVQLAEAYPESKVVIVERAFDKWEKSFEERVVNPIWDVVGVLVYYVVLPIQGNRAVAAMRKILYGAFGAQNVAEIRARARITYKEYYARVREAVPPERRLEYKLGDGWEPLCQFLGKDVPDVEFPWVNEAEAHAAAQQEQIHIVCLRAWAVLKPWAIGSIGAAVLVGAIYLL